MEHIEMDTEIRKLAMEGLKVICAITIVVAPVLVWIAHNIVWVGP